MQYSGLIKYLKRFRQPANKQKIYVFLLCLFCSAVFWLTIKLSRENQAILRKPLALYDVPEGTVLFNQSDSLVSFALQTTGVRLIGSRYFSPRDSVRLSVASLPGFNREGRSFRYVTANMLSDILAEQLESGSAVLSVRPDTIFFEVMERLQKKVPVQLHAELSYEKRFGLYGDISLKPDSVFVQGPASFIDTIRFVKTEHMVFQDLQQPVNRSVQLEKSYFHESVVVFPESVDVAIDVAEYTEAHVEVPLNVQCEDSTEYFLADRLRLFPDKVDLYFLVALRDFQKVRAELFSAYVECPDRTASDQQLKVKPGLMPDYVRLETVRPARVDYLIMQ